MADRPVVYINVFTPGGTTDTLSRLFCAKLGDLAGQRFIVENRSGAGGTVGQTAVAQATPDGYTVGLGSAASLSIAPSILPDLSYNPAKDSPSSPASGRCRTSSSSTRTCRRAPCRS